MGLGASAIEILEPYVGRTVADTCVRATAIAAGKTADDLAAEDLPVLSGNIRKLLSPIAPSAMIDGIVAEIGRRT